MMDLWQDFRNVDRTFNIEILYFLILSKNGEYFFSKPLSLM